MEIRLRKGLLPRAQDVSLPVEECEVSRKVAQHRSFFRYPAPAERLSVFENLYDNLRDIVDVTLRIHPTRDGKADKFHGR